MDYNGTTPVHPSVVDAMMPSFQSGFGNPSSSHHYGRIACSALQKARSTIAKTFDTSLDSVTFTSGGTESIHHALHASCRRWQDRTGSKAHMVISAVEHVAVTEVCHQLEYLGHTVSVAPVTSDGIVEPEAVVSLLQPNTAVVSIMLANNETGVLQPIAAISTLIREATAALEVPPLIHCDTSQAGTSELLCGVWRSHARRRAAILITGVC